MQSNFKNLCKELQTHDLLICHIPAIHFHLPQGKGKSCNFTLIHQWVGTVMTVNTFIFKFLHSCRHFCQLHISIQCQWNDITLYYALQVCKPLFSWTDSKFSIFLLQFYNYLTLSMDSTSILATETPVEKTKNLVWPINHKMTSW